MTETEVVDNRQVTAGWLNYRGDLRESFDMTKPYGPKDVTREMIWPLVIEYDPASDMTRVGFTFQMPPQVRAQAEALKGSSRG